MHYTFLIFNIYFIIISIYESSELCVVKDMGTDNDLTKDAHSVLTLKLMFFSQDFIDCAIFFFLLSRQDLSNKEGYVHINNHCCLYPMHLSISPLLCLSQTPVKNCFLLSCHIMSKWRNLAKPHQSNLMFR